MKKRLAADLDKAFSLVLSGSPSILLRPGGGPPPPATHEKGFCAVLGLRVVAPDIEG